MSESKTGDGDVARALAKESGGLYKLLVDTVRDYAIFALDTAGNVVTWNAGAERFKGYRAEEIIGKHFSVFYTDEDRRARKPEKELVEAEAVGRVEDEGWRVRKDGTRFWANVVITAVRDSTGNLIGFSKVTRDLTERRAAELRAIEDARRVASADSATKAKAEFLASMSHELRTPLNAIGGYADLLLLGVTGELAPEQRDYLERIRRSQQHLLGIISDLLNFSRIDAGRITYDMQPMLLGDSIRRVLPMVEPQAKERGLTLSFVGGKDLVACADQAKVEQILLNLLSNAIKFTKTGGSITLRQISADDRVGIRVDDTGIGIPTGSLESIFDPFVQVGRTLAGGPEGAGLGLAISRDLARAMGGDIVVKSETDVGSTFEILLKSEDSAPAGH